MPGAALASAVAREVAGRMYGRSSGKLGEILLPGASGLDMLGTLSVTLGQEGLHADVVIDNAHRIPRSEEHTSELQSLMRISYAVFCLQKKKQQKQQNQKHE